MRNILNYPQIDRSKIETVKILIDRIAEGNDDSVQALHELNRITGKIHAASLFAEYWGWTDLDSLAEKAVTPEPPCVRDLTKDEITEIVSIARNCLLSGDDNKAEYYEELLHKSLSLPNAANFTMSEKKAADIADDMLQASSDSVILL